MLSIKEYLAVDRVEQHYTIPLHFFARVRYYMILWFFEYVVSFNTNIFVDSTLNLPLYWQMIINYIKLHIQEFKFRRFHIGAQGFFISNAFGVYVDDEQYAGGFRPMGNGSDTVSQNIAISKAIGEALERYATSHPDPSQHEVVMRQYEIVKTEVCMPDTFHSFSEQQYENFSYLKRGTHDIVPCVPVEDMHSGYINLYPSNYVFWISDHSNMVYHKSFRFTTSGCGAGFSIEEATLSAIYENIERDSFSCYWLTHSTPPQISIPRGEIREYDVIADIAKKLNAKMWVLDITTDIHIPSVLLLMCRTGGEVCVAAGCGMTYRAALKKCLSEGLLCIPGMYGKADFSLPDNYRPFLTPGIGREERLALWRNKGSFEHAKFLIEGYGVSLDVVCQRDNDVPSFATKQEEIQHIQSLLSRKGNGYEYMYRYTPKRKYLKDLGYFVARVIMPKLYPLYLVEHHAFTKSDRLNEFFEWKYGKKEKHTKLHTYPHPFP